MSCGSGAPAGCCGSSSSKAKDQIDPSSAAEVYDSVKDYYGKRLQGSDDLKTSACTTGASAMPRYIREAIGEVHDEVVSRYYGCGLVVPQLLKDAAVLDLGSGAGRDCFVLSKLVGENGRVVGVDMTEEQLEVARRHVDYHREKFGHATANVEFRHGYIEKLGDAGLADGAFDVIVSNCVVNLVPDKEAVLRESYRVLRDGGELYFSDVYASRVVGEELRRDAVLWGECISGALYWRDLVALAARVSFAAPRLVRAAPIDMKNDELRAKLGDLRFVSATYRLVKLPATAAAAAGAAESKAQRATYDGGDARNPERLEFDQGVSFPAGRGVVVAGDVAAIVRASRFSRHVSLVDVPCDAAVDGVEHDLNPFALADRTPAAPGAGCCSTASTSVSASAAASSRPIADESCCISGQGGGGGGSCCPPAKKSCC